LVFAVKIVRHIEAATGLVVPGVFFEVNVVQFLELVTLPIFTGSLEYSWNDNVLFWFADV
jgi:hypothetical protein